MLLMKPVTKTLKNGLRVMTVPMPSVESATLTIWARTGSRFEKESLGGISHFLEHMAFKGGKRYPTAKVVAEAVDSLGAANNASTSKEWTNYWIKLRADVIERGFDILFDMLLTPALRQTDIDREKGVILEEMAMYEDTPMAKIGDVFENLIFKGESLGRDIIGTKKSVTSLTKNDFVSYRKHHYYPENMLITVSGGVTPAKIEKLALKYTALLKKTDQDLQYPKDIFRQNRPQVLLKTKKTDQAHLIFGFRTDKRGHKEKYTEAVLAAILGGGMSSRLWTEVREKRGLAYAVRTASEHYLDSGYLATYAGVPIKKISEAIKIMKQEYQKITQENKISPKELTKAKEYLKGHLALSLEDTEDVNQFFGIDELLLGKMRTPQEVYRKIDAVTGAQVTTFAKKFFQSQGLNLAVIGPYQQAVKFERLIS